MQHIIPFKIATAAAPAGNDGIVRISAGTLPWTSGQRVRMKMLTASSAIIYGYWGAPDLQKADMAADIARFGSSGNGANNSPPTYDFMGGGQFTTGMIPEWFECPTGDIGSLTLYGTADGTGLLIFEPMPDDHACCPNCGTVINK